MKFHTLILLSDHFPKIWRHVCFSIIIFLRAVINLLRLYRRTNVISYTIDDRFLFENGYLFISWRVRNLLWVKINNKIVTTSKRGIIVEYKNVGPHISIEFKGLFNSVAVTRKIIAENNIVSSAFIPPVLQIVIYELDITNTVFKPNPIIYKRRSNIKSSEVKISLTQFNKENYL